jgi:hypothetical protein
MRQFLRLHPDSSYVSTAHIEVEIHRPRAGSLALSYNVTGKLDDISMPPVMAAARSGELWRQTCFEAFIRASSGSAYYEFNFAPSTQWAAYRFSSYRSGMSEAVEVGAPIVQVQSGPNRFTLQASLELDRLLDMPATELWRLGLSALIEDRIGRKSYWALAHPPGKPDFHHSDCFTLELSPDVRP